MKNTILKIIVPIVLLVLMTVVVSAVSLNLVGKPLSRNKQPIKVYSPITGLAVSCSGDSGCGKCEYCDTGTGTCMYQYDTDIKNECGQMVY